MAQTLKQPAPPSGHGGRETRAGSRHHAFLIDHLGRMRPSISIPLVLADAIALCGIGAGTYGIYRPTDWHTFMGPMLLYAAACLGISRLTGLYRRAIVHSNLLDAPSIVSTTLQGSGLSAGILSLQGANGFQLSLVGSLMLLSMPCRPATRFVAQITARRLSPRAGSRALIIGAGHVGQRLAATLIKYDDIGLTIVGFVDDHEYRNGLRSLLARPIFPEADLERVIEEQDIHHVVFAFSRLPDSERVMLVRLCKQYPRLHVSLVPRLFEAQEPRTLLYHVHGIPLVQFEMCGHGVELACKRILDVVLSCLGLAITLPLLLLAALAIRLEGPGPVLFRQQRVGRGGRIFIMYKLRSMRESLPGECIDAASRHTAVGRILRNLSIDELPQLWNVLRGDMSLVGPRPEREEYVQLFTKHIPCYEGRHRMRGGITGLAQASRLRGDTSIVERTRLDNFYIDYWSLWLDVKLLLRTFTVLIPASHGIGGDAMLRDIVSEVAEQMSVEQDRDRDHQAGASDSAGTVVAAG